MHVSFLSLEYCCSKERLSWQYRFSALSRLGRKVKQLKTVYYKLYNFNIQFNPWFRMQFFGKYCELFFTGNLNLAILFPRLVESLPKLLHGLTQISLLFDCRFLYKRIQFKRGGTRLFLAINPIFVGPVLYLCKKRCSAKFSDGLWTLMCATLTTRITT